MDRLPRQQRVCLELAHQALTNDQIAARLGLTTGTVKQHLNFAYARLGLQEAGNPRVAAAVLVERARLALGHQDTREE